MKVRGVGRLMPRRRNKQWRIVNKPWHDKVGGGYSSGDTVITPPVAPIGPAPGAQKKIPKAGWGN